MLGRKLVRELRRQRGQAIAVLAVIALGVMLFVTSAAAYLDLRDSYAATRRELALADFHIDTTDAVGAERVAQIAALPNVSAVTAREVAEVVAPIDDAHVQLRLLSLPDHGQPALDRVLVLAGHMPGDGELLVEKHLADQHHLQPGDVIAIENPPRRLRVAPRATWSLDVGVDGAMLVFGSILAAAILFSTAILGVLEHRRDLATLRALGRTLREIAFALTIEHGLLALAGIGIGIPIARLVTRHLVQAFSSDLFALPFVISPITLALSTAGVFVVLLVAQWPALRSVGRMSLAESVRSREG